MTWRKRRVITSPKIQTWLGNEGTYTQLVMNCAACRRSFKALGFFNTIETTKFRPTLEITQKEKTAWTLDRRIRLKFRANQSSSKPKRIRNHFKAWNFRCTIQTNLLGEEGVSTDEKILLLTEHLRIGLGHMCPRLSPPLLFSVTFHWSWSQAPSVPSPDTGPLILDRRPLSSASFRPRRGQCTRWSGHNPLAPRS